MTGKRTTFESLCWILTALLLLAAAGCGWELDKPLTCGDGQKADEEQCDGAAMDGKTCKSLGYTGGTLKCTTACKLDRGDCYTCGDGKKGAEETCDGAALGGKTCKDLKDSGGAVFSGGTLACKKDCSGFDTSDCYRCGDDVKGGPEACDGKDLDKKTCIGLDYTGGELECKKDCSWFDTSGCFRCGDKKKNGTEKCEGKDLGGKKCTDLGFKGGTLSCKGDCSDFDTSACYRCGDDKKTPGDVCDGKDLAGKTCKTYNYEGGTLVCNKTCSDYDTSGCYKCGDNKKTGSDVCDGADLGGKTCKTIGWEGGTLACKANCSWFDESGCYKCGDKTKNSAEKCDGPDLGGADCVTAGMLQGQLKCKPDCSYDVSGCLPYKWTWARRAGAYGGQGAVADSTGGVFVSGAFLSPGNFGTHKVMSNGGYDVFLTRLDSSGTHKWALGLGGPQSDQSSGVYLDKTGNAYLGGRFSGELAAGSSIKTGDAWRSDYDIWVAKATSAGAWVWAVSAGSDDDDQLKAMVTDSAGNSFITGFFSKTASFGTHKVTSAGGRDIFLAKLDSAGKFLWVKSFGASGDDSGTALALDKGGNIHLAGTFSAGSIAFGSKTLTNTSAGPTDLFVVRLDSTGKPLWAASAGSVKDDTVAGLGIDSAGNTYVLGDFKGTMTMGTSTLALSTENKKTSKQDFYVAKLDSSGGWLWGTSGGGLNDYGSSGLVVDEKGNSYITVRFKGTIKLGSLQVIGLNQEEMFLAKVDTSGKPLWATFAGGNMGDSIKVTQKDGKELIVVGYCTSKTEFGKLALAGSGGWTCVARVQVDQ